MRSLLLFAFLVPSLIFAQDSIATDIPAAPVCPVLDSLKAIKKAPKGMGDRAMSEASDSSACTTPYFQFVKEKSSNWKKLRKILPEKQPDNLWQIFGSKKLSADEQKRVFFSKATRNPLTCEALADTISLFTLSGKDWMKRTTAWDTSAFFCKNAVRDRVLPLLDSLVEDTTARRAKLLAFYPEIWFERFAESSSDLEKVLYSTNPSLSDSSHCRYADYASADQLEKIGIPTNACANYFKERFGAPLFRIQFRKTFKPSVLAQMNKRLAAITPENLEAHKGFLDTIEILFGDGESWEVLDSLEASILKMLAANPLAVKELKDPTATMLLTAFDAHLPLLCEYPDITDRMLVKLINDRANDEKPLPTEEELAILKGCLSPNLIASLERMLQQLAP